MQDSFEVFAREVPIADTNHAVIGSFEKCCAGGIIGLSVGRVVRVALELHDEVRGIRMLRDGKGRMSFPLSQRERGTGVRTLARRRQG